MTDNNNKYIDTVYNEKDRPFTKYPNQLIKYLIKRYNINAKHKLLELGCGRGEFLYAFQSLGINGYGVDISDSAKKICDKEKIFCIDFLKEKIPFEDNSFDVVYSKSFIEHFYYPEEIFKEIYRVLKPSGIIINLTPDWEAVYKNFYEDFTHRTPFTIDSLRDIYLIHNFKEVKVEKFKQLPILWTSNFFLKIFFDLFSKITEILMPNFLKKKFKWIKFSKEIMLLSSAKK